MTSLENAVYIKLVTELILEKIRECLHLQASKVCLTLLSPCSMLFHGIDDVEMGERRLKKKKSVCV